MEINKKVRKKPKKTYEKASSSNPWRGFGEGKNN